MSRELEGLLRRAAATPAGELDTSDLARRARRIGRWRRGGGAAAAIALVAASGAVATVVGGEGAPGPDVVVEPGPTRSPSPTATATESPAETAPTGITCEDATFTLEWRPEGLTGPFGSGPATDSDPGYPVRHLGGPERFVELHFGPLEHVGEPEPFPMPLLRDRAPTPTEVATSGEVVTITFAEEPPEGACGLRGLRLGGLRRGAQEGVVENLRVRRGVVAETGRVVDAELLAPGVGWALTGEGLWWTIDEGRRWYEATPDGAQPGALRAAHWLDRMRGWAVSLPDTPAEGGPAAVWRTTDGGASWQATAVELPAPSSNAYGPVTLAFRGGEHGYLLVALGPEGSPDHGGVLFETTDGGAGWQRLSRTPTAGGLSMARGALFVSGGPGGSPRAHVSRDGGQSWSEAEVGPPPDTDPRSNAEIGLPHFVDLSVAAGEHGRLSGWALSAPGDGTHSCAVGREPCLALFRGEERPSGTLGGWEQLRPGEGEPPAACVRDAHRRGTAPTGGSDTLAVFFSCQAEARPTVTYGLSRPASPDADTAEERVRAALVALLAGPTEEERARGYRGVPFEDPEGLVRDVTVRGDGTATVDYAERLTEGLAQGHLPTARLSAGLTRTALAVDGVTGVRHTTGDTCAFGGPRDGPCPVRTRDGAETGRP